MVSITLIQQRLDRIEDLLLLLETRVPQVIRHDSASVFSLLLSLNASLNFLELCLVLMALHAEQQLHFFEGLDLANSFLLVKPLLEVRQQGL